LNPLTADIFSFSIVIAAIIGVIRLHIIDKAFLPFILLLWAALLNEIATSISINLFHSNAETTNVYSLIEASLVTWQFKNWRLFTSNKLFKFLLLLFLGVWLIEVFFISSISTFITYFNVLYSFIIVLMSIQMINKLIVTTKNSLLKNASFLICLGFVIFFTYSIIVEIFWWYGLEGSDEFTNRIYEIVSVINLFVNLIFAVAVLFIPQKQRFIVHG
jgi:hypothetical protein